MRRNILFVLIAGMLFTGVFTSTGRADGPKNERALVTFNETVKLRDVFLRGEYLFVHDADKMAKGENCTWIYDAQGKLVTSFHCVPIDRPAHNAFKVIVHRRNTPFDTPEVREIQFAGSTEGHRVP
jgi:hypothetical protein